MNVSEWVCVPAEAKREIEKSYYKFHPTNGPNAAKDVWNAMLAAAPSPAPVPVDPAELEALRRDAARYRFIRSGKCHVHAIWFQSFGERFNLMESDLDDSVDAALAANGEKVA